MKTIFRFSIFDRDYPVETDYKVRNTILSFLSTYFQKQNNDEILFFINNEFETNNFSHRAKSRLKLFRRLFRISNKNSELVTVQRDYLAGILSTDIAKNYIKSLNQDEILEFYDVAKAEDIPVNNLEFIWHAIEYHLKNRENASENTEDLMQELVYRFCADLEQEING